MKVRTILVAAVMILGLSAAAFAQATYQVGSIPVTTVTTSGQTEKTGDITFTQLTGANSNAGTISINYGVPITIPAAAVIISSTSGSYVGNPPTINTVAKTGTVIINVPAGNGAPGSFTLSGVRVAVAGTSLTSLTATISSVNNAILAGQTTVTVINAIAAGLAAVGDDGSAITINGVTGGTTGSAVLSAEENYLDAFGPSPTDDTTLTTGRIVRFTLSGNPPAGVTLGFPAVAELYNTTSSTGTNNFRLVDPGNSYAALGGKNITSSSTDLTAYYQLGTSSDSTAIEYIDVPITVTVAGTPRPIAAATITYTATLAPIGAAFDSDGNVITSPIPRFVQAEVGTGALLTVTGSKTALLIPFAGTVAASGFNTGIAVANTTTDPGKTVLGVVTGAVTQSGTIKFYFYNAQAGSTAPTVTTYTTTAGSPGTGLDATGAVPSGSTYSVLLSQLLDAAGFTGDFSGYVFAIANFTNAHAQYVLTDFKSFANGGQGLIISTARASTPEVLGN